MDINNLTSVYNQNPSLQGQYSLQQYLDLFGGSTYTPPTTPTPTPAPSQGIINQNINQYQNLSRSGDDINRIADKTSLYDYRNPGKSAYGPKGQLEINPSAFGMSFPEQPGSNKEGIAKFIDSFTSLPTRSLSSFTSPTTGGNITGPAEQGFMSQVLSNDPAGRTREELMSSYDDYNRFIGRSSQFADARQKGPGGNIMGSIFSAAAGIPFLGSLANFGGKGKNTSDRRRYAVDNAGFGQGTGRDEFGVFTGGKTLFGKTGDYGERMTNKIDDIESFFSGASGKLGDKSLTEIDFDNLTEDDIENMKRINGTLTKQYFAYKKRGEVDVINKKENAKKLQEKIDADNKKAAQDAKKAVQDAKNARDLVTIQQRAARGDSMSDIGRDMYTGPGQAFEKQSGGSSGKKGTSTERNYGGRKDGGLMGRGGSRVTSYFKGGIVSLRRR